MYYWGRWYDPLIGRWVQPDSVVPEPGKPAEPQIDFALKGNILLNLKKYDWAAYTALALEQETQRMIRQAKAFLKYHPRVKSVLKGSVPDAVRAALEAIGVIVEVAP